MLEIYSFFNVFIYHIIFSPCTITSQFIMNDRFIITCKATNVASILVVRPLTKHGDRAHTYLEQKTSSFYDISWKT